MTTSPAAAAAQSSSSDPIRDLFNQDADKQVFLELWVAQLRHQDPLNPQDPTQFISQLAEFSSLEQLIAMRQSLDAFTAEFDPQPDPGSTETTA